MRCVHKGRLRPHEVSRLARLASGCSVDCSPWYCMLAVSGRAAHQCLTIRMSTTRSASGLPPADELKTLPEMRRRKVMHAGGLIDT